MPVRRPRLTLYFIIVISIIIIVLLILLETGAECQILLLSGMMLCRWLWVCVSVEDVFSLLQLDASSREWLVFSSQANYHALAKLAAGNPRLARFKVGTCVYRSSCSDVSSRRYVVLMEE
jgi:hypothetical protein